MKLIIDIPEKDEHIAFSGSPGNFSTAALKLSSVAVNGSDFPMASGMKYGLPGSTSLTELTSEDTRFMASTTVSFPKQSAEKRSR